jgi:DNA polymerase bacteriophage-type
MHEASCDFESRSDVDLRSRGAGPYFASKHFMPLMLCYSIDRRLIQTWTCQFPACPEDLREHIRAGGYISAWNASFERQCFEWLEKNWGWPHVAFDRYKCSMATASALGLPRSLEKAGEALNLPVAKDKRGTALINIFSKPRKPKLGEDPNKIYFNEPEDRPQEFEDFKAYCFRDTETEMAAASRMIPLSNDEQAVYTLSEKINSRGIRIDRRSAVAAINLVEKAKASLDARMNEVTGGAVSSCTQVARLTAWAAQQGVKLDGVAKDDILVALDLVDLPEAVRAALMLRQEAGKSSTSKLKAFLNHAGDDDRVRGSFVYHGAAPGRWSNVGVNFANLPRPRAIFDDADLDPATLFQAFRSEEPALLKTLYGDELGKPLHLISDALRGFLVAAPGHDFIAVDYSGIQGAICAWMAGEEWKMQAMREIIADPALPDMYRRTAAGIMNSSTEIITKKHWARQIGKVSELALGFGGGPTAFLSMAKNYQLGPRALHDLYGPVRDATDAETLEKAEKRYARCCKARDKVKTDVLTREAWLACEIVKIGWRKTNSAIAASWATLEAAMRDAARNPGTAYRALKVDYIVSNGYMFCRLPSKRCMAYAAPRLREQVWAREQLQDGSWAEEAEVMDKEEAEERSRNSVDYGPGKFLGTRVKIEGATSPKVTALGVNSTAQKLERYGVYGGLGLENIAMGVERDILVCGLKNCENAGYGIVAHTYDESVAEVPRDFGSIAEMEKLMLDIPEIYSGLPLSAHGYRAKRYRK